MGEKTVEVRLHLVEPKEVLSRVYPNGRLGGIVIDGRAPGPLGQRVELLVYFAEPASRHFKLRGRIGWVRHQHGQSLKQGFGIDFDPSDSGAPERLLRFAGGLVSPDRSRFAFRLPVALPVRIVCDGQKREEQLVDLSEGGAFIRTPSPLPINSVVTLSLKPPRSLTRIEIRGRVAWIRPNGEDQGMGVEFQLQNARQGERLKKLLQRLEGD
ncbi:MAG: PilZ domain-containing protein [Myxococcales bacterium]|nr:PilZ domain-containing protein [Myxococcales bacterium]